MNAKNGGNGISSAKMLNLYQGDVKIRLAREERKRQQLHNRKIDRIAALANLANDSIAAAECGDAQTAAKLHEEVCRGVFHECTANICKSCPIRNEMFETWIGKNLMETDSGSLCMFAREVTQPRLMVRGCQVALQQLEDDLAKTRYKEGRKRIELADLESSRKVAEKSVEEARRELAKAKSEWASVFEKYSK